MIKVLTLSNNLDLEPDSIPNNNYGPDQTFRIHPGPHHWSVWDFSTRTNVYGVYLSILVILLKDRLPSVLPSVLYDRCVVCSGSGSVRGEGVWEGMAAGAGGWQAHHHHQRQDRWEAAWRRGAARDDGEAEEEEKEGESGAGFRQEEEEDKGQTSRQIVRWLFFFTLLLPVKHLK